MSDSVKASAAQRKALDDGLPCFVCEEPAVDWSEPVTHPTEAACLLPCCDDHYLGEQHHGRSKGH